ncbi:MAG TPA: SDR family NAD(P)-dependent oxidoreductase [Conexibacter sp.]|jgi:NAD(P)-dependent dehydrogenase (short-subunit alcohol dehydrogenase family)
MGLLEERVALVTGAASGIGAGIARVLAREGATLVLTDLDTDRLAPLAEELGATALAQDVTSWGSCEAAVAETIARHGRVDVLVNNAGITSGVPFQELTEAEWDRVNDVNAKGVFLSTRAVVDHMIKRRDGAIVSISSMAGKEGLPLLAHYCATKFAVIGITQSLAKELAPYGVNVNAVCPGVVRTPLWEPLLDDLSASKGITREQAWQEFVDPIPLGRPQEPEDIGEAVAFLASERARNMTGQAINVTGGMQVH